jgi:hypothetical protein
MYCFKTVKMTKEIDLSSVGSTFESIFEHGKELAETIGKVNDDIAKLKNLAADDVTCLKECIRNCETATHKIKSFADGTDDVYYYWSKGKERVREGLNRKDYSGLKLWIETLQRRLDTCEEQYKEFQKCCESLKISENLINGIAACQKHANEADSKKTTTQVVGGVGSGVALAGGVAGGATAAGVGISVVAGVFTFGIGTAVGLAITGGVVGTLGVAAGTAGAIATGIAASKYAGLIKSLGVLKSNFSEVEKVFNRQLSKFNTLKVAVDNFARAVKDLEIEAKRSDSKEIQQLMDALELVDDKAKRFKK